MIGWMFSCKKMFVVLHKGARDLIQHVPVRLRNEGEIEILSKASMPGGVSLRR